MSRFLAIPVLLSAVWAAAPGSVEPRPRDRAADEAAQRLLGTHLFAEGRGMHFRAPGVLPLFHLFERVPLGFNDVVGRYLGANMAGRRAVGMFEEKDERGKGLVVFGCALCHSGRAAGRLIAGLGNKRIDVGNLGTLGHMVAGRSPVTTALKDPRWTNRTKGLVPDSLIQRWFFRSAGLDLPEDLPAAAVKVPHLWGYGEKRRAGLFCDGLGDGAEPGWAAMVELATGQTPETVRGYRDRLEDVERGLAELLPPAYPFITEVALVERGRAVFEETCSGCHGGYRRDPQGFPLYETPRHIGWETVGTDRLRLLCITPQFRGLVANNPLKDLIRATDLPPGYFAPRLEGVWARFPYLHNASVPTIRDLLTEPSRRPAAWPLQDAGEASRFDQEALGLKIDRGASGAFRREAARGNRDVYTIDREGHSNQGHAFGTMLPESSKRALIEYLKTI
jgi:mono/diheme cytochrome c family protein